MPFDEVIGQEDVKENLRNMFSNNRIPHAALFIGQSGSGTLPLALSFAQLLLCSNPKQFNACGTCSNCIKSTKLIHPDLHFSFPTIGRNVTSDRFSKEWRQMVRQNPYINVSDWLKAIGDEKSSSLQGNINKEECLNIIKKLGLKSFENERKIMVIWMAEFLQKEGNRLLKIIEEPPKDTFFLLIAEKQEAILNTILSRCQLIKVPILKEAEILSGLEALSIPSGKARFITTLADGDFNLALKMVEEKQDNSSEVFVDWMRKCYKGNGRELVEWAEKITRSNKQQQKYLLQYGLHYIRELSLMHVLEKPSPRLDEKEVVTAEKMKSIIGIPEAEKLADVISACYGSLERNGNPKILFLDASIQSHKIMRKI